jgi:RNA polymerase sigma-70 factor (ECF subfamily)
VSERGEVGTFERVALPHLGAAFNLARWLARNDRDAEDIVQEAFLRAHRFFAGYRGVNARAWVLAIVRNTYHSWREKNHTDVNTVPIDDRVEAEIDAAHRDAMPDTPLTELLRRVTRDEIDSAIADLPIEYREVFILREMEDFSYKEIAEMAQIPIGTVMSRLSRARQRLKAQLRRLHSEHSP